MVRFISLPPQPGQWQPATRNQQPEMESVGEESCWSTTAFLERLSSLWSRVTKTHGERRQDMANNMADILAAQTNGDSEICVQNKLLTKPKTKTQVFT